jgi:hypothetical protein
MVSKVPNEGRVLVLPDGDDGGRRCAVAVFEHVGRERCVRWLTIPTGKQPTDCSGDELHRLLGEV